MIKFSQSGSFDKTEKSLRKLKKLDVRAILNSAGARGVAALASATPRDTSLAAGSWTYEVHVSTKGIWVLWNNTDSEEGFPVAIMLQYGYATGTGGYVSGRDYINPAIKPIFDQIANDVWKAVTNG